jgi:serine/threonine protein phosphatase PrpC
MYRYRCAFHMDIGPRKDQEDCLLIQKAVYQQKALDGQVADTSPSLLLVVCDGMGGHVEGETASRFVCEAFLKEPRRRLLTEKDMVAQLVEIQDQALAALPGNSGTTVAGIWLAHDRILGFNLGDSRIYRFAPDGLQYISHDHSLVQSLLDDGVITEKEAFSHPYKNVVSFGIGPAFADIWPRHAIHIFRDAPAAAATYLICSDGVNDILRDREIFEALAPAPVDNGALLMAAIKEKGLRDNTSFIIVEYETL